MDILIDILMIAWLCVFVIDCTTILPDFENWVKSHCGWWCRTYRNRKPFSCSLCMSWWLSIAWIIIYNRLTLPYMAFAAFVAFLTPQIKGISQLLVDSIQRCITRIDARDEQRTNKCQERGPAKEMPRKPIGY